MTADHIKHRRDRETVDVPVGVSLRTMWSVLSGVVWLTIIMFSGWKNVDYRLTAIETKLAIPRPDPWTGTMMHVYEEERYPMPIPKNDKIDVRKIQREGMEALGAQSTVGMVINGLAEK